MSKAPSPKWRFQISEIMIFKMIFHFYYIWSNSRSDSEKIYLNILRLELLSSVMILFCRWGAMVKLWARWVVIIGKESYLQKSCSWKLFLHNHWNFHLGYHFTNGYFQLPINFDSDLHVANDYRMEKLTGPKLLPINISVRIYRISCVTHRWNPVKMQKKNAFINQ